MAQDSQSDNNKFQPGSAQTTIELENSTLTELLASPPPLITRGLLYLIVLFTTSIIIWATVNKFDVILSVPASVLPEGRLKYVQPPMTGRIQKILVKEGDKVKLGDELLVYQTDEINPLIANLKEREKELSLATDNRDRFAVSRAESLQYVVLAEKSKQQLQTKIHKTNHNKLAENRNRLQLELKNAYSIFELLKHEYDLVRKLSSTGVVPAQKVLELARHKEESAFKIDSLKSSLRENAFSKIIADEEHNLRVEKYKEKVKALNQQIETIKQEASERYLMSKIGFDRSRDLFRLRMKGIVPDVEKLLQPGTQQINNIIVMKAPVDGLVADMLLHNPGETINRGETVLSIIPAGVSMIMELDIADKDIGKIIIGQQVKYKFAAFPFIENGVLSGSIESIGSTKEKTESDTGDYYQAISQLDQDYFRVNGKPFYLLPGMSATAEIRTEKKRIIDLLLAPIKSLAKTQTAEK